jgi:hypothetical protein
LAQRRTKRYSSYKEFMRAVVQLYRNDLLGYVAMSGPIEWHVFTPEQIDEIVEAFDA